MQDTYTERGVLRHVPHRSPGGEGRETVAGETSAISTLGNTPPLNITPVPLTIAPTPSLSPPL